MKIALVCPASLPATQFGGILFLSVHIAKYLSNIGHKITIYTTNLDFANNASTFNKKLPTQEKIENYLIKRTNVWFSTFLFFVNPGMYKQMMNDDFDIIHAIGVRSFQAFIATLVSKRKKIPLVISDQGGLTTHPDLKKSSLIKRILIQIQKPLIKFVINNSTKVIVANEYEKTPYIKPISYGIATLTGLSRINDQQHWASDVFIGAALGYFTSKTLLRLHNNKKGQHFTIYPRADRRGGGIVLSKKF